MMNIQRALVLTVASIACVLAFLIPPYYYDGSLIGGTIYFPLSHPPADDPTYSYSAWLLKWELAFIALSALAGWTAFGPRGGVGRRTVAGRWLALNIGLLLFSFPSFNTILAPELTWYGLTLSSVVLVVVLFLMGPEAWSDTVPHRRM
jgi:hypothetical protein